MNKIISLIKKTFSRNKTIDLFPKEGKPVLAELGGNYCQDMC